MVLDGGWWPFIDCNNLHIDYFESNTIVSIHIGLRIASQPQNLACFMPTPQNPKYFNTQQQQPSINNVTSLTKRIYNQ